MAVTVTKTTNCRFAIADGTLTNYFPADFCAVRTIGDNVLIEVLGRSARKILDVIHTDITSPAGASAQAKATAIEAL